MNMLMMMIVDHVSK